jgi:GT2 family glycosyltransferase
MDNLHIVIVTYNGMSWLSKCLESCKDYNTIVVDNASTDETVSVIETNYPYVKVLKQTINLGFGQANNIGIKYALDKGADYVFLMNQDCYLQPNTIYDLTQVHLSNRDFGIVSPVHFNGDGTKLDKGFSNYLKQNDNLIYDLLSAKKTHKSIYNVSFVNAAAWLLPRKTLETVGGFDPIFFHYGEDDNYCQRVLYHDFKIGIVPNSFVYHDRENRQAEKIVNSKNKLVLKERYLKSKWANLNLESDLEIKNTKKDLFKLIVKLVLKLKLKKARYYFSELQLIKNIVIEIQKSKTYNKVKGKHYLS